VARFLRSLSLARLSPSDVIFASLISTSVRVFSGGVAW
jgi:hypothetical protein